MSTNETLPPKSAATRVDAGCGGYGCLKPGNNTDIFPTLDNLTMGCGASNCGIPAQKYLDQALYDDAPTTTRTDTDAQPPTAPNYSFYEDEPFAPEGLTTGNAFTEKGYGNFKPRGWTVPDAYSGKFEAQGSGAAKGPADFEAWQRGTSFPSQRYPLGHLPIRDPLLAQEAAKDDGSGMSTGKKVGIAAAVIAGLGLVGGLVYYVMSRKGTKQRLVVDDDNERFLTSD